MKPRSPKEPQPVAPGAFAASGSYLPDGRLDQRGHVDGLVRALVAQRRRGELSLALAVRAIRAANAGEAFPHLTQWVGCEHWALAFCSTAAEETVKREGRGATGHWCGQRYAAGPERDCGQASHRAVRMPVAGVVAEVGESMDDDLPAEEPAPKVRTGESSGAPDEAWFARQGRKK